MILGHEMAHSVIGHTAEKLTRTSVIQARRHVEPEWCIQIRVVESESLKVGKSLKIGKNQIKSEKSDLISY